MKKMRQYARSPKGQDLSESRAYESYDKKRKIELKTSKIICIKIYAINFK